MSVPGLTLVNFSQQRSALAHIERLEYATRFFSFSSMGNTIACVGLFGLSLAHVVPYETTFGFATGSFVMLFIATTLASVQQTIANRHQINLNFHFDGTLHRRFVGQLSWIQQSPIIIGNDQKDSNSQTVHPLDESSSDEDVQEVKVSDDEDHELIEMEIHKR